MIKADLIVCNASELITCAGDGLGLISKGWLAIEKEKIVAVGNESDVLSALDEDSRRNAKRLEARGKTVMPGFVDCHTHLVFGGDRLREDASRLSGQSVAEMKALGLSDIGMSWSVKQTRDCDDETLFQQSAARLKNMIANGATTIECKSGYGLNLETELRQLETTRKLAETYNVDLVSTFLGAHGWPDDLDKDYYLDSLIAEMIPAVAEKKLAAFCDIWVDEGFFTAADARRVLGAGLEHGMRPKIHAEAYSYIGASDVAAELKAASADHLNYTPPEVMARLARAGVVGVLAPGTDFVVRHPLPANPRLMMENGLEVAVATNCNPGCWCDNMPFALGLAVRGHGLSIEAALRGATVNGAKALGLKDRGRLVPGYLADFLILNIPRHEELFYKLGGNFVEKVYSRGSLASGAADRI